MFEGVPHLIVFFIIVFMGSFFLGLAIIVCRVIIFIGATIFFWRVIRHRPYEYRW